MVMEQIGKLFNQNQQITQPCADSTTTALDSKKLSQNWPELLLQMAQDMRQDWAPGQIEYWKRELQTYSDQEITEELRLFVGEFFPNVKAIREGMERRRDVKRQEVIEHKSDRYWVEHERNNRDLEKFMQAHQGKTPMQVYCEENREEIKRLDSLVTAGAIRNRSEVVRGNPPKQQTATGVGEQR